MKILFDFYHLPQYNFFRNAIRKYDPSEIEIAAVRRGKLVEVIKYENPNYLLHIFGDYKYNKSRFSMLSRIIIPRIFKLVKLIRQNKYDMIFTAHYQANFAAKLLGIKNITFLDDPRKGVMQIVRWAADEVYVPPFSKVPKGTRKFNALKEWAYLSPSYFDPKIDALRKYGLKPKEYIFIREVVTDTSNYIGQSENIILSQVKIFSDEKNVVLSLENKALKNLYPKHWIILEEPIEDIHSLIYYSKTVISSGDSIAREGGVLGVPSIYLGFRDMPANQILISKGIFFKVDPDDLEEYLFSIKSKKLQLPDQEKFRTDLLNQWDDITEFVQNKIKEYTKLI